MQKFFEVSIKKAFFKKVKVLILRPPILGATDRREGLYGGSEGEPLNIRNGGLTHVAGTNGLYSVTEKKQASDYEDYLKQIRDAGIQDVLSFKRAVGGIVLNLSNYTRAKSRPRKKFFDEYLKKANEQLEKYRRLGNKVRREFSFVKNDAPCKKEPKIVSEKNAEEVLSKFKKFQGQLNGVILSEPIEDESGKNWLKGMYGGRSH